jgi:putative membrane protein insertion efficiency factor
MTAQPKNKTIQNFIFLVPRRILLFGIKVYQRTLSPDHGFFKHRFPYGYCPFFPSCSAYAHEVIEKDGAIVGSFRALWRIIRCHPWTKGGVDRP